MARYQIAPGYAALFDTSPFAIQYGVITIANASLIRVQTSNAYQDYFGSFHYHGNDPATGTIYQTRYVLGGSPVYVVSQMNADLQTVNRLSLAGNVAGIYAEVFKSNDTFIGAELNDRMLGFNGNDTMIGNAGNDRLNGMNGNDLLNGGRDNDVLIGGPGNDHFVFAGNFGDDRISDFSAGPAVGDVIQISHVLLPSFGYAKNHATLEAGHVVLHDTAGHSIALLTVHSVGALSTNDFVIT